MTMVRCISFIDGTDVEFTEKIESIFQWINTNVDDGDWNAVHEEMYLKIKFSDEEVAAVFKLKFGI